MSQQDKRSGGISDTKHSLVKGLWRANMVLEEQKGSAWLSTNAGEPELDRLGGASGSGEGFCSFPSGFGGHGGCHLRQGEGGHVHTHNTA